MIIIPLFFTIIAMFFTRRSTNILINYNKCAERRKRFMTIESCIAKAIATIAKKSAEKNVNSTCMAFFYQPKIPSSVKKLRKI